MRRAARTDANHAEIMKEFRAYGFRVRDTSQLGDGFPDLVVYRRSHGVLLVEVKDGRKPPSERKMTPAEDEFSQLFPVHLVESRQDVAALARPSNKDGAWRRLV